MKQGKEDFNTQCMKIDESKYMLGRHRFRNQHGLALSLPLRTRSRGSPCKTSSEHGRTGGGLCLRQPGGVTASLLLADRK